MNNFPTYCNNGRYWLNNFPTKWDKIRLKYLSEIRLSNVDKKKNSGELEIMMCNYTHVYYNDIIDEKIEFDEGTCTEIELHKFGLKNGDVIITKDSETQDDNGVPCYVSEDLPNVVCGYHLSIITPKSGILDGMYLFWLLKSQPYKNQFEVFSKGVTRYGINRHNVSNMFIPLPPISIQKEIVIKLNNYSNLINNFKKRTSKNIEEIDSLNVSLINELVKGD